MPTRSGCSCRSSAIPDRVKQAFIAAEDQNFYQPPRHRRAGHRPRGPDQSRAAGHRPPAGRGLDHHPAGGQELPAEQRGLDRRASSRKRSWPCASSSAFTKDQILELYLNQIFLGFRSYGVAAAALNYFDKSLDELTSPRPRSWPACPRRPPRYDPRRNAEAARDRRDYVIGRMLEDGYIGAAEAEAARAEPLTVARPRPAPTSPTRRLLHRGGPPPAGRPARRGRLLRGRPVGAHHRRPGHAGAGRRGACATASPPTTAGTAGAAPGAGWSGPSWRGDWAAALKAKDAGFELWQLAARGRAGRGPARRAARPRGRQRGAACRPSELAWARRRRRHEPRPRRPSSLVESDAAVEQAGRRAAADAAPAARGRGRGRGHGPAYRARAAPSAAASASARASSTARPRPCASPARRSSRSSIWRPGGGLHAVQHRARRARSSSTRARACGKWKPENYSEHFYGPSTLRLGLEKSRNVMTVRLAQAIGMERVRRHGPAASASRDGLGLNLAASLGAERGHLLEPDHRLRDAGQRRQADRARP